MRTGIIFEVSSSDRLRLEVVVRDRNAPQKHVWQARIILLSADGVGTAAIMRKTGKSKACVWVITHPLAMAIGRKHPVVTAGFAP